MRNTSTVLSMIAVLVCIAPLTAAAGMVNETGELSINRWHVHLSRHAFEAESGQHGYLEIRKNTPGLPIQMGFVRLNRRWIPLKRFLDGSDTTLRKTIMLQPRNQLRVLLVGSPGASITIVIGTDLPSPPPAVELSAMPSTIAAGATGTLAWSCRHADGCTVKPDIGPVDTAGSIVISPTETTTYTLTATGPGGTTTASATVAVVHPAPAVEISVEPDIIGPDEVSILSWHASHSDACVIEPDIGNVESVGLKAVAPLESTTYTITATGLGGTATAAATVVVHSPMRIEITSPLDGDTIDRPDVMVQGTYTNSTGAETGITVNGKVAMVYGDRFVVNHMPLEDGPNTITATATDINGNTQSVEGTVSSVIPEHHINLISNIESGSAPQTMTLGAAGTFSIQDATFSHTGISPDEFVELTPDEYEATFTNEGIAFITAEASHAATTYRDTIGIVIVDKNEVDTLLKQKWTDMKTHLAAKNVIQAVRHFDEGKKGLYEEIFSALLDRLPQIANDMQDISLISIDDRSARYRIRRVETHNTGTHTVTYYVYFIKDETGIWKIYRF